ncbi:uncharacterized protein [Physcomitrium patens]|uniref:Uncharacterized protein n=1 Tax=Physcomitrium patens TaxID=3218 RepID=A9RG81_PHYPA|nr:uncharacterized protein LOC112274044 [Physcomitrium patens]XP_024358964.1 uncharacterized protein LOC112274044 [Physcomitrium patens]XP_024358972.1 uncharacterized protein LOC112274044 [Physcomitrium patens]PNR59479.1 hypothetical protein PHYPA_002270 [Physcomitrium patens]|eukprot:XP_024358956.1 uncharacterized protein LOC112274044 [Physcomitrella patens]
MPLTGSAVDVLGVTTLVLVLLLVCAGIGCIAYVLYFRARIQKERLSALQDFNSLWIVRIILIGLAILWSLVELLRLPLLRRPNWVLHSLSFKWQANLCRLHILSSLGFLEPCFFLTALFLVHGSLRKAPFTPRKDWNGKVVGLILLCCLPVFLLQLFFVFISPRVEFKGGSGYILENEGYGGKVPYYFTQAFEKVMVDTQEVVMCRYPLWSTLVLAGFGILYSAYFLLLGWRMVGVVINRYLQRRLYSLLGALLLLLPLHVIFLGLSVLSKPTRLPFELLSFFGFIMVLLCSTIGEGILVIRPIADALAVTWVVYAPSESGRDTDFPEEGPMSVSMSIFGSDDDEASLVGNASLFAKSQSRTADVQDNEYTSARSFLRPLERTGSFSENNVTPFFNPDSSALPGKPLIAHHQPQNPAFYPFL